MNILATILVVIVALEHVYFLVLEMFLWTKPQGMKTFRNTPEKAEMTKVLAANQGLYNGFLAAGLFYSLFVSNPIAFHFKVFFLACVIAAGLYGGVTFSKRIIWVQAVPAILGLVFVLLAG